MLDRLSPPEGATKKRKRVGRGRASGTGKTSGKGHKGQKARSGGSIRSGFEGGQMPMHRRLPKRGFSNYLFKKSYEVVNVSDLERFEAGTTIDPVALAAAGLVRRNRPVKILGTGEISKGLTVTAHKFSGSARSKIEGAGGTATDIDSATSKEG